MAEWFGQAVPAARETADGQDDRLRRLKDLSEQVKEIKALATCGKQNTHQALLRKGAIPGPIAYVLAAGRTMMKCLVIDGTGLRLTAKKLLKGHFAAPWQRDMGAVVALSAAELALLLDGSQLVFIGALSPRAVSNESVVSRSITV